MTRSTSILTFLFWCFSASCSNESRTDHTIIPLQKDSMMEEAIVEEKISTKSNFLIDLSNEKSIEKLLCQGWVMDDDKDILIANNDTE